MTVEDIADRLNEYFLWLSSRQLEKWWPALIAIAALVIVLIILRLKFRRKVLPSDTQLRDIIGIELADDEITSGRTDHIEKDRSTHVPEKRGRRKRRKNTKKGFNIAIEQPRVLKVYEIVPDNEPFTLKATNNSRTGQHPIQKASEIEAVNKKFQLEKPEPGQSSNAPEQSAEQDPKSKKQPQPFDIVEFSKSAISRQQRLRSHIFKEYSDLDEE